MLEMILYTLMFAVLGYGLLALCGLAGGAGPLIAGLVVISAVLAALLVSYQNTRERLVRLERKLDAILDAHGKQEDNERSD